MFRIIILLIILVLPEMLPGQTPILFNQFHFNTLSVNPAFAGSENAMSATINYRNQWTGFDDAPKSSQLALHSPLKGGRTGLGFHAENNSIGIYETTNITGIYAYRVEVKDGTLALGMGFGVAVYAVNWNNLQSIDRNDQLFTNNSSSAVMPVFNFGTYYYTKKYYIGISIPSLLRYAEDDDGGFKAKNDMAAYSYFVNGGLDIDLSRDIVLRPSVSAAFNAKYPTRIYMNSMLGFKEKVWVGLGYRSQNTVIGLFQCQLNYQLRLAYAYDFANGELGKYLNGSHEIGLNYIFRYSRKVMSPRSF